MDLESYRCRSTATRSGSVDTMWGFRSPPIDHVGPTTPILINVRDRLEPLRRLVGWLEVAGHEQLILIDNASTYPPLRQYLEDSPHRVVALGTNLGHRAPWTSGVAAEVGARRHYVVTDPDILPDDGCPHDVVAHFHEILCRLEWVNRVGIGLRIDDLPDHYAHAAAVRRWESQFWADEVEPGVFRADVDTTFALYRPGPRPTDASSVRTGAPYVARHLPWYTNSDEPNEEEAWYRRHADPTITSWDLEQLPTWLEHAIASRGDDLGASLRTTDPNATTSPPDGR